MARSADPYTLTSSIVVGRDVSECWDLYVDNLKVPKWAPAVLDIESDSPTLVLGGTRKSHIFVDGRTGYTIEKCTELNPLKRIEFSVIEETFGFAHMLNAYGFSVSFDVEGSDTLLVMETHYIPKKIFASLMTAHSTQQQLVNLMAVQLEGFKSYAETVTG